jgi:hypothetical protein
MLNQVMKPNRNVCQLAAVCGAITLAGFAPLAAAQSFGPEIFTGSSSLFMSNIVANATSPGAQPVYWPAGSSQLAAMCQANADGSASMGLWLVTPKVSGFGTANKRAPVTATIYVPAASPGGTARVLKSAQGNYVVENFVDAVGRSFPGDVNNWRSSATLGVSLAVRTVSLSYATTENIPAAEFLRALIEPGARMRLSWKTAAGAVVDADVGLSRFSDGDMRGIAVGQCGLGMSNFVQKGNTVNN